MFQVASIPKPILQVDVQSEYELTNSINSINEQEKSISTPTIERRNTHLPLSLSHTWEEKNTFNSLTYPTTHQNIQQLLIHMIDFIVDHHGMLPFQYNRDSL